MQRVYVGMKSPGKGEGAELQQKLRGTQRIEPQGKETSGETWALPQSGSLNPGANGSLSSGLL